MVPSYRSAAGDGRHVRIDMPSIATNGIQTHFEMKGEGAPVVLVSGLGGTGAYWGPQIEALSRQYQVITYDQRGAGGSDHPDMAYSIEMLADDLEALISALGVERPALIGHSTGGAIGQILAARGPDLLRGMVQYASWSRSDVHFNWVFRLRRALLAGAPIEEYVHGSALFLYPPEHVQKGGAALSERLLGSVGTFPDPAIIMRRIDAIMAHDAMAVLGRIRIPTLVVCANDDILTPPYQARILAEAIPEAELRVLPEGGHSLSETQPEIFNRIVLDFLASITATAA